MRSIRLIFVKNHDISSNLKIGHFGPKMNIWFIGYSDERIGDKKLRFMGNTYTKKKNETNRKYFG